MSVPAPFRMWSENSSMCSIRHVKVRGRPLSPTFGVQNVEPSGDFVLKYRREVL